MVEWSIEDIFLECSFDFKLLIWLSLGFTIEDNYLSSFERNDLCLFDFILSVDVV